MLQVTTNLLTQHVICNFHKFEIKAAFNQVVALYFNSLYYTWYHIRLQTRNKQK